MSSNMTAHVRAVDPILLEQQRARAEALARRRAEIARREAELRQRVAEQQRRAEEDRRRQLEAEERARRIEAERRSAVAHGLDRTRQQARRAEGLAADVERRRVALEQRVAGIGQHLDRIASQRAQLRKRVREMKEETRATQGRAADLEGRVGELRADVDRQMEELERLRESLERELGEARDQLRAIDAADALSAVRGLTALDTEQAGIARERAVVDAQIQAYSANAVLGVIVEEMIAAAADVGYTVERVFATETEVEFFVQNARHETLRIAALLSAARVADLTRDPDLQFVLHGLRPPTDDTCIRDTVKLLERLRERGVAVTLTTGGEPRPAHALQAGTSERSRERD